MKKIQSIFSSASLILLMATTLLLSSCEKEAVQPTDPASPSNMPGKFKRNITLQEGANSMILEIGSDKAQVLDSFEAVASLQVITEEAETVPNAVSIEMPDATPSTSATALWSSDALHIRIISKSLAQETKKLRLAVGSKEDPSNGKVGAWHYGYFHNREVVFHSYDAGHMFYINPYGSRSAAVSFFIRYNGGSIWLNSSGGGTVPVGGVMYRYDGNNAYDKACKVNCQSYWYMEWD